MSGLRDGASANRYFRSCLDRSYHLRFSFLTAVLVLLSGSALAQQGPSAGLLLGYEFGAPLDIGRDPGTTNPLTHSLPGASQNHTAWTGFSYSIPQLLAGTSLQLSAQYGFSQGSFESSEYLDNDSVDAAPEDPVRRKLSISSTSHLISPALQLDWELLPNVNGSVGFWGSVNLGSTLSRKERITTGHLYRDTRTSERDLPGDPSGFPTLRYGPSVATSLLFEGSALTVRAEAFAKLDLTSTELGTRAFSGGVRGQFFFKRSKPQLSEPPIAEPVRRMTPPVLRTSVRITSRGISLDSPVVAARRMTLHRSFETLNPFIRSRSPRTDTLVTLIADRMISEPSSTVELRFIGSNRDNGRSLQEELKTLLVARGVDPSRIALGEKAQAGQAEGVMITSSSPTLMRPRVDQRLERQYHLPPLTIERYIESEVGVRSWQVRVMHGTATLAEYDHTSNEPTLETGLPIHREGDDAPLLASLTVQDLIGQTQESRDTLIILPDTQPREEADSVVSEYLLFDATASPGAATAFLTASNNILLRTLREELTESHQVVIRYQKETLELAKTIVQELTKKPVGFLPQNIILTPSAPAIPGENTLVIRALS